MDFTGNTLKIVGYQVNAGTVGGEGSESNSIELIVDNNQSQVWGISRVLTKNPTSRGTPVADHSYRQPVMYSVKGLLSSSTLSSSLDFNLDSIVGSSNYLSTKVAQLLKASLGQYIFEVYTGLNFFPAMGVVNVSLRRSRESYNALMIDLTMQELLPASNDLPSRTKDNADRHPADQGVKHG